MESTNAEVQYYLEKCFQRFLSFFGHHLRLKFQSDKLKNKSEPSTLKEVSENDDSTEEDDQKFVQRGNCTDYFAKKMAVLKAKGKFTDVPAWTEAKANPRNLGLGADKVV